MKARLNSIGATDIRRQRGEIATVPVEYEHELADGRVEKRMLYNVDRVQDYLARYAGQGHISPLQRKAGERFSDACDGASVGISSQLGRRAGGGEPETAILRQGFAASAHARHRDEAVTALGLLAGVALWVCRDGRSAQDWAVKEGKPPRDGIAALRLALDTLVMHYGLTRAASGSR